MNTSIKKPRSIIIHNDEEAIFYSQNNINIAIKQIDNRLIITGQQLQNNESIISITSNSIIIGF